MLTDDTTTAVVVTAVGSTILACDGDGPNLFTHKSHSLSNRFLG